MTLGTVLATLNVLEANPLPMAPARTAVRAKPRARDRTVPAAITLLDLTRPLGTPAASGSLTRPRLEQVHWYAGHRAHAGTAAGRRLRTGPRPRRSCCTTRRCRTAS